jgi:hypothetical protein
MTAALSFMLVVCFAIDPTQKRVFSRHASLQILAIASYRCGLRLA